MSIVSAPTQDQPPVPGAQLAQVLTLVSATAPLPKPTSAALRLVCKATKFAIDHCITKLELSSNAAWGLRAVGNPLLSGLTSLRFRFNPDFSYPAVTFSKAFFMAMYNAETLETFELVFKDGRREGENPRVALGTMWSYQWPRLRSLTIFNTYYNCQSLIKIDSMPILTELHLHGRLEADDVGALAAGKYFASNIEVLELGQYGGSEKFTKHLKDLLSNAKRLRCLIMNSVVGNVQFLTAELPSLEILHLLDIRFISGGSLSPIACISRPSLHTLHLGGDEFYFPSLAPLLPGVPGHLSAVRDLKLFNVWFAGVDKALETHFKGLTSLSFRGVEFSYRFMKNIEEAVGRLERVGKALTLLPDLEALELDIFIFGHDQWFTFVGLMSGLFTGIRAGGSLSRLRRLKIGAGWRDVDYNIGTLIYSADQLPELEELVMQEGIDKTGCNALAQAGRQGIWPNLKLFEIKKCCNVSSKECDGYLKQVWPGLEFKVTGTRQSSSWAAVQAH